MFVFHLVTLPQTLPQTSYCDFQPLTILSGMSEGYFWEGKWGWCHEKNIGMSYIKIKRRSQAIWSTWSDFDDSGYEKPKEVLTFWIGTRGPRLRWLLCTLLIFQNTRNCFAYYTCDISKTFRTKKSFENLFDARVRVREYFWVRQQARLSTLIQTLSC